MSIRNGRYPTRVRRAFPMFLVVLYLCLSMAFAASGADLSQYTTMELITLAQALSPRINDRLEFPEMDRHAPQHRRIDMIHLNPFSSVWNSSPENGIDLAEADEKVLYLRTAYEREPETTTGLRAAYDLGLTLYELGRYAEAVPYLERTLDTAAHPIRARVLLSRSYEYLGRLDKAEEVVSGTQDLPFAYRLAYLLQLQGRLSEAAEVFRRVAQEVASNPVEARNIQPYAERRAAHLVADPSSLGTVVGRITVNGEPIPGVQVNVSNEGVVVNPPHVALSPPFGVPSEPEALALTDANGEYRMNGIPPGGYVLSLHLPWDLVAGSEIVRDSRALEVRAGELTHADIHFRQPPRIIRAEYVDAQPYPLLEIEWAPHPEIRDYELHVAFGADWWSLAPLIDEWQRFIVDDTILRMPLDERFFFMNRGYHQSLSGTSFGFLFGLLAPNATLNVSFERPKVSTVPAGPQHNFEVTLGRPNLPLTPADELLFAKAYDEAIAAYEQHLAQHPDDVHSLTVLAYIFYHGVDLAGTLKDLQRAVEYVDRLAELRATDGDDT